MTEISDALLPEDLQLSNNLMLLVMARGQSKEWVEKVLYESGELDTEDVTGFMVTLDVLDHIEPGDLLRTIISMKPEDDDV